MVDENQSEEKHIKIPENANINNKKSILVEFKIINLSASCLYLK